MANSHGDELHPLVALSKEANRYDFYAALRQLECIFNDKPRLGQSLRSSDDQLRLEQEPSNLFAPSTLYSCQFEADHRWHLRVLFFGLFGPNGALPHHLTEYVRERQRQEIDDQATLAFFNLFHHRLLSLFYRAWANKEPTVNRDRPEDDHFDRYIGSLLGIGIPELQNKDGMPDDSKRYFAAYLGDSRRHVSGLLALIRAFFSVPSSIEEFVGEWLTIPLEARSSLGKTLGAQLGVDTVLGSHSWQCQYKFRIRLGPMNLADYEDFLPNKKNLKLLKTIIRNYLGDELNWEVQLILKKEQVPAIFLGKYGCLGLNTWLYSSKRQADASDLILNHDR